MVINRISRPALFLILAAFILLVNITAARLVPVPADPLLAYAVLVDLMLCVPLLYWYLVARPAGKRLIRALPAVAAGAFLSWLILPAALKETTWQVLWPLELGLLAAELAFLLYEGRLLLRVVRRLRALSPLEPDPAERLRTVLRQELGTGRVASFVLHDATLLYYALFSWKQRPPAGAETGRFTYHRSNNQILYAAMLTKILLIEAAAVHLIVQQWSHIAAWLLTAADLWLLLLIWSDCRASVLQPVRLDEQGLRLRYGLRIQADIPLQRIVSAASRLECEPDAGEKKSAALPMLGAPNIRIELQGRVRVAGLLFLPREVTTIYLALDEPERFIREWTRLAGQ